MVSILDQLTPEEKEIALKKYFPQGFQSQVNETMPNAQVVPPQQTPVPVIETPAPAPATPAPVETPKESGFDWNSLGDAIGIGLSGIGDAYSAAAGRNTNFGKNALEMVQNKQKLEREQAEKAKKDVAAREMYEQLS